MRRVVSRRSRMMGFRPACARIIADVRDRQHDVAVFQELARSHPARSRPRGLRQRRGGLRGVNHCAMATHSLSRRPAAACACCRRTTRVSARPCRGPVVVGPRRAELDSRVAGFHRGRGQSARAAVIGGGRRPATRRRASRSPKPPRLAEIAVPDATLCASIGASSTPSPGRRAYGTRRRHRGVGVGKNQGDGEIHFVGCGRDKSRSRLRGGIDLGATASSTAR